MKILTLFGLFVVIFVLSIPFHEFLHILAAKCLIKYLGGRTKLKVTWLSFDRSKKGFITLGSVELKFYLTKLDRWKKHSRWISFIISSSGGLGTAIVMAGIGIFFRLNPITGILSPIWLVFLPISIFHLVKGIGEAKKFSMEFEELSEEVLLARSEKLLARGEELLAMVSEKLEVIEDQENKNLGSG